MIRVTVELDHGGRGEHVERLTTVCIGKIPGSTHTRAGYRVWSTRKGDDKRVNRAAQITDWPRLSKPVLSLVKKALEEMGY